MQLVEETMLKVLKLHEKLEARIMNQGQSRQENIGLHCIVEVAKDNSTTIARFE